MFLTVYLVYWYIVLLYNSQLLLFADLCQEIAIFIALVLKKTEILTVFHKYLNNIPLYRNLFGQA